MDEIENIDEIVDEIIGEETDAGEAPEKRLYTLACVQCGNVFRAKSQGAMYCPDCLRERRRAGGRKSAAKAHGLRTQPPAGGTSSVACGDTFPKGEGGNAPVTRAALLDMAKAIVGGERENQYGSPEDSFRAIAHYWTVYLQQVGHMPEQRALTAEDTAIMMILLKVARQAGRGKLDNWIDIAGYAACGGEITEG